MKMKLIFCVLALIALANACTFTSSYKKKIVIEDASKNFNDEFEIVLSSGDHLHKYAVHVVGELDGGTPTLDGNNLPLGKFKLTIEKDFYGKSGDVYPVSYKSNGTDGKITITYKFFAL